MLLQTFQSFEIHRILVWILEFKANLSALSLTPKRRRPYRACSTFHSYPALNEALGYNTPPLWDCVEVILTRLCLVS